MTTVPPPGAHGGDAAAISNALGLDPAMMIDLSASMNPFAPDTNRVIADVLRGDPRVVGRYPDPDVATGLVAAAIGVGRDRVVLTNGASEAIALVAGEVGAGNVVEPEFSLYRRYLARVAADAPRWRSNPSNPSGNLAGPNDTAAVWDEAFYPLATGKWTRGDDQTWRIGSLTKLWNCPGIRLGYIIAPTVEAARRVRVHQPEWAVNGIALAMIPELLALTDLDGWCVRIDRLRAEFSVSLQNLGYATRRTTVNWVLIDHPTLRADLAVHGVVVRDCASFGLPNVHRVALPMRRDLDRVLAAFEAAAQR